MTFTYVGDYSTNLDKVRRNINDTVASSGPLPGGTNFTDEELGGIIDVEGNWQRAVAAVYEMLTAAWRTYANLRVGPRQESYSDIADGYADLAKRWREEHGSGTDAGVTTVWTTRVDAYSDDVDAGEV